MIKLPVFAVVGETYEFVRRERRLFWALAVPGIIVLSLISAFRKRVEWDRLVGPEGGSGMLGDGGSAVPFFDGPFLVILFSLALLIECAVLVLFAVAWHRAYLVPEESPSPAAAYRRSRRQTNFVMNNLRLLVVFGPLVLVGFLMVEFVDALKTEAPEKFGWMGSLGGLIVFVGIGFIIFLAIRLSLIFPAAAVDHPATLRQSWNISRGNAWRLLWVAVLVALPFSVFGFLPKGLAAVIWGAGLGGSWSLALLSSLLEQVLGFVYLALGVSALSICYRRLTAAA